MCPILQTYSDPIYGFQHHSDLAKVMGLLTERNAIVSPSLSSSSPDVYYDALSYPEIPKNVRSAADLQSLLKSNGSRTSLVRNPSVSSLASFTLRSRSQLSLHGSSGNLSALRQPFTPVTSDIPKRPKSRKSKRVMFKETVGSVVGILNGVRFPKKKRSMVFKLLFTVVILVILRQRLSRMIDRFRNRKL
jgi:hypothetical protein